MSVDLHRQAGQLAGEADTLMREGRMAEASRLYKRAAELEAEVVAAVPEDRVKTRGILAGSAVGLFRKSGDLSTAIRYAHLYLAQPNLPSFSRQQLNAVLTDMVVQQESRAAGRNIAPASFTIFLRGNGVRTGLAPLDTVILKLQQFLRYTYRISEWTANLPFRAKWPPDPRILSAVTPMVSEARAGSFQFTIRLETPMRQLNMFDDSLELPLDQVVDRFSEVLDTVTECSAEDLKRLVSDSQYRHLFVGLVRNLIPDGRDLSQVEIQRSGEGVKTSTILTPAVRRAVKQHLAREVGSQEGEIITKGVLRAVDLDKGKIRLVDDDRHKEYRLGREGFDDIVGPFVNRRVQVEGHFVKSRFVIDDILPD